METIYNGHSNKSGVYKIFNKLNGRIYIGSAKEFKRRYKGHFNSLKNNKHKNKFLQADFNKCGEESFMFEVMEVVNGDRIERQTREQYYIDQYYDGQKQCYNLSKKAFIAQYIATRKKSQILKDRWKNDENYRNKMSGKNHPCYGKSMEEHVKQALLKSLIGNKHFKHHTEESKKKLSEKHKGKIIPKEQIMKRVQKMKGRKLSDEHKKKISESSKGRMPTKFQKEQIEKVNSKTYDIKLLSPTGEIFGPITNMTKFCKNNNLSPQKMYCVIKKTRKHHKG